LRSTQGDARIGIDAFAAGQQSGVSGDNGSGKTADEEARRQERLLDVSREDREWLNELRMFSDLIIAVARTPSPLEQEDIDRALGL
jgi:hypothetical protein